MQFFGHDWTYIGHKAELPSAKIRSDFIDLSEMVAEITGIDIQTLRDRVLDRSSVAQRMSWAAKRCTSRREDSAYCLLGLFSINMPLLYGEGDRAFLRLQEEIIRVSDDHSVFGWRNYETLDPIKAYSGMLAPSVDAFADASHIVRTEPDGARRPYTTTNVGLRIELPLRNRVESRDHVLCLLNCRYQSSDWHSRLGVHLTEPWTFNDAIFLTSDQAGMML